jgi:nitrogen fixation protein FixH
MKDDAMSKDSGKFTGWHATAILVVFFGVVITVNITMAAFARSSFGGIVVENSYVASQEFNGWLDEAEKSAALGWQSRIDRRDDGRVSVFLDGAPHNARLDAVARHPLGRLDDIPLTFAKQLDGSFLSDRQLPGGRWTVRFEAVAGESVWRSEEQLR